MSIFNKRNNEEQQGETQKATLTSEELEAIDDLITQNLDKFFKKNKRLLSDEEEDCYVLPSDIKSIIEEFSELELKIKACEHNTPDSYINLLCAIVESTIVSYTIRQIIKKRIAVTPMVMVGIVFSFIFVLDIVGSYLLHTELKKYSL